MWMNKPAGIKPAAFAKQNELKVITYRQAMYPWISWNHTMKSIVDSIIVRTIILPIEIKTLS